MLTIDQIDRLLVESLPLDIAATLRAMRRQLEQEHCRPLVVRAEFYADVTVANGETVPTYLLAHGVQGDVIRFSLCLADDKRLAPMRILHGIASQIDKGALAEAGIRIVDFLPAYRPSQRTTLHNQLHGRKPKGAVSYTRKRMASPAERWMAPDFMARLAPVVAAIKLTRSGRAEYSRCADHARITTRL